MNKEKKRNELVKSTDTSKTPLNEASTNISPLPLENPNTTSKKFSNFQKDKYLLKNESLSKTSLFKQQFNLIEILQKKLININNNINLNIKSIEKLRNSLNQLKLEKNNKKSHIINLLSNKESLDEIYNNYIDYLKNKNKGLNINNKKFKNIKSNPLDNQDEDEFEILISEIKEIDLNKFIEQTFNLIEDIFENPNQQLKLSLKEIINKSYSLFNNSISSSPFLDTYSIVSNFFLRISIFLSNQSNGKYSETIINLFLRCLVKMNSINVKNEKLINYMNTKYKEDKKKIKEEISSLINKNEILDKSKIVFERQIKDLEIQLKNNKNIQDFETFKINNNINYNLKLNLNDDKDSKINSNNENNKKNHLIYISDESNKEKNTNYEYIDNEIKKNEIKDKLKNKFKKVYKEDIIEINKNEDFLNNNININYNDNLNLNYSNNNEYNKIYNENQIKGSNKESYNNIKEKTNKLDLNYKYISNINENKKEKLNIIKKIDFNKNNIYNNRYNSKSNKHKEELNKDILIKKIDNNNTQTYNSINNYHGLSIKNITKKGYISPQINTKMQIFYRDNIINDKINNTNYNPKVLDRIYYNKKFKATQKEPKKKLNYHYYTKKISNNIISYNDINKNMKCDLAKKIKYLDKVNKNNTSSTIKSRKIYINNNKSNIDISIKNKRLFTEKKEKKFNYNFFDIINETNNKRNYSGENKFKSINNLNSSSNFRNSVKNNYNKKEQNNKFIINNNNDHLIKSDTTKDRKKSFYDISNVLTNYPIKNFKNGIEIENNNGYYSPYKKYDLSFSKKKKNINDNKYKVNPYVINKNKNKKQEMNLNNKINILNNRNQYYHSNKNTYSTNSGQKVNTSNEYNPKSFKKEKYLFKALNKENKNNKIYFTITESKLNENKSKRYFDKINKNENKSEISKSNSNISDISKSKNQNQNLDKGFNSCSKQKNRVSNYNYNNKFNKSLLLKRSLSSTLNKLFNNNLRKKNILDSYNEYNNNNSSNNSFNISNSFGVSCMVKKEKEIISYNEKNNKFTNNKEFITNLKIGPKDNDSNNKNKRNNKFNNNNILKISNNNITNNHYNSLLKIFKRNKRETFCYFKIFENDFKNNKKFNPLENCSINPEILGYCEGYISIDINENYLKLIPKIINRISSSNKNIYIDNEQLTKINLINSFIYENNNYNNNLNNKNNCLKIELKEIYDINQSLIMNNIIKIHRLFIKYNSGQKSNINNYFVNNTQINDVKAINLNKLIYIREIKEINMPQNEKIKAALCNYFSFSFYFSIENYKNVEIELIFINFEHYNLWNNLINTIVDLNKKKYIKYNKEELIENKKSINNSKDFTHNKGNIENGSTINEDISKLSNNDIILNI